MKSVGCRRLELPVQTVPCNRWTWIFPGCVFLPSFLMETHVDVSAPHKMAASTLIDAWWSENKKKWKKSTAKLIYRNIEHIQIKLKGRSVLAFPTSFLPVIASMCSHAVASLTQYQLRWFDEKCHLQDRKCQRVQTVAEEDDCLMPSSCLHITQLLNVLLHVNTRKY